MSSATDRTTPPAPAGGDDVELLIGGMTCASCAARIEKRLNKLDGVTATVNYATEKAKVTVADGVTPLQQPAPAPVHGPGVEPGRRWGCNRPPAGRRGAGRRGVERERGGVRRGGAVPRSEWAGAASPRRFVHSPPGHDTDAPGVHR